MNRPNYREVEKTRAKKEAELVRVLTRARELLSDCGLGVNYEAAATEVIKLAADKDATTKIVQWLVSFAGAVNVFPSITTPQSDTPSNS